MSVLESLLLLRNDGTRYLSSYTAGKLEECDLEGMGLEDLLSTYRSEFRKGFDSRVLLGDEIDDYMYTADTSDAIKDVLAHYSPYLSNLTHGLPLDIRKNLSIRDTIKTNNMLEEIQDNVEYVTYYEIMHELESCAAEVFRIAQNINNRAIEEGNTDLDIKNAIRAALYVLIECDEYPNIKCFSTNIRKGYLLSALTNRVFYAFA